MVVSTPEKSPFEPTASSVLNDMLAAAIGPDNPMTTEASQAGLGVVRARLARAQEIIVSEALRDGEEYDSEAVAAVMLMQDEQQQARERQQKIHDFPEAATSYWTFVNFELAETAGASFFRMHFPASEEVTEDELALMTEELQAQGWLAEVAPTNPSEEDSPLGIKIVSEVQ